MNEQVLPGSPATGHDGRRPPLQRRASSLLDGFLARALEARGVSRGNADGLEWIVAYSLSSRFGLPGNRARRRCRGANLSLRFGLPSKRSGRMNEQVLPGSPTTGHDGRRPPLQGRASSLLDGFLARALEARGVSRGNADGLEWIVADSLSLRFGLPSKRSGRMNEQVLPGFPATGHDAAAVAQTSAHASGFPASGAAGGLSGPHPPPASRASQRVKAAASRASQSRRRAWSRASTSPGWRK